MKTHNEFIEEVKEKTSLRSQTEDALSEEERSSRKSCERCGKDSDILQGDFGELLCPKCYKEVVKSESSEVKG